MCLCVCVDGWLAGWLGVCVGRGGRGLQIIQIMLKLCVSVCVCVCDAHVFQSKLKLRGSTFPRVCVCVQKPPCYRCLQPLAIHPSSLSVLLDGVVCRFLLTASM